MYTREKGRPHALQQKLHNDPIDFEHFRFLTETGLSHSIAKPAPGRETKAHWEEGFGTFQVNITGVLL